MRRKKYRGPVQNRGPKQFGLGGRDYAMLTLTARTTTPIIFGFLFGPFGRSESLSGPVFYSVNDRPDSRRLVVDEHAANAPISGMPRIFRKTNTGHLRRPSLLKA